ncbi:aspartate/glutamate racemase family protein [Brenneria populi subsp. brevivirga]|uniref:aspartate/glutamate racemase family protein n=1 Tax=Brenneria populi TaxID=1505588 RepID=UPI002E18C837|nr:aspartate/glutamate racemase family protein [Brenneria populi subsp. brevivirga]
MPKIAIINPNTTLSMTERLRATAQAVAPAGIELIVTQPQSGVASIEGYADGVKAAYALLERVEQIQADGWLVACADDTGVDALREACAGPVIGIGQAAMQAATLLGARYSILTPMQRSVAILANNARRYGLDGALQGVHALNLPVLDIEENARLTEEKARQIIEKDRSECLVLGCAGFTHFRKPLENALRIPVIDGVQVGLQWLAGLINLGLATSKSCTYNYPESKQERR